AARRRLLSYEGRGRPSTRAVGREPGEGDVMTSIRPRDMVITPTPPRTHRAAGTPGAERGREFWRRALLAGAFTALPRWTCQPMAGVGEHEARIPDELVTALRRLANELAVPLSSVLLTAHAKVLAALSGERWGAPGTGAASRRH